MIDFIKTTCVLCAAIALTTVSAGIVITIAVGALS